MIAGGIHHKATEHNVWSSARHCVEFWEFSSANLLFKGRQSKQFYDHSFSDTISTLSLSSSHAASRAFLMKSGTPARRSFPSLSHTSLTVGGDPIVQLSRQRRCLIVSVHEHVVHAKLIKIFVRSNDHCATVHVHAHVFVRRHCEKDKYRKAKKKEKRTFFMWWNGALCDDHLLTTRVNTRASHEPVLARFQRILQKFMSSLSLMKT